MKRLILNRPLRLKPRVSERIREIIKQGQLTYYRHETRLSPYVESPDYHDSESQILLIGNCGTDDEFLSSLCWLTDARDDALQDLLAAINNVDLKGISKVRMQSVYAHWGYVQQLDNATAVFVGALITREQQAKQKDADTGGIK